MNKEQAAKHGKVIKWWLDNHGKGVWVKAPHSTEWGITYEPSFYLKCTYVQNDQYSKFRKAQVDGKIIERDTSSSVIEKWKLFTDKDKFEEMNVQYYRIKLDESRFKIGDWVVHENGNIFQLEAISNGFFSRITKTINQSFSGQYGIEYMKELWEPKVGEWCIFSRKNTTLPKTLEQYSNLDDCGRYITKLGNCYNSVAPLEFIQTLKGNT